MANKNTSIKGYKIDFENNTLTMNYTFAAAADEDSERLSQVDHHQEIWQRPEDSQEEQASDLRQHEEAPVCL